MFATFDEHYGFPVDDQAKMLASLVKGRPVGLSLLVEAAPAGVLVGFLKNYKHLRFNLQTDPDQLRNWAMIFLIILDDGSLETVVRSILEELSVLERKMLWDQLMTAANLGWSRL